MRIIKHKLSTRDLVLMALLIALNIILVRFAKITLGPTLRISFGFIPTVIMAVLFGPLYAGIGASIADFIGAIIFPSGPYFFGFTLTSFVTGLIYGKLFYKKRLSLGRIATAKLLVILIANVCMNTFWLTLLTGQAFWVILAPKIGVYIVRFPIDCMLILLLSKSFFPLMGRLKVE